MISAHSEINSSYETIEIPLSIDRSSSKDRLPDLNQMFFEMLRKLNLTLKLQWQNYSYLSKFIYIPYDYNVSSFHEIILVNSVNVLSAIASFNVILK